MSTCRCLSTLILVTCFLLCLVQSPNAAAQDSRPAMVGVETVGWRDFSETMPVLGQFVAVTNSTIASRVPGIIQAVDVAIGQHVVAGQPIARLDGELLEIEQQIARAALREAEAGREIARTNLEIASQTFARIDRLKNSAAFSRSRFDDLRKEMERSESEIARSEAQILNAKAALARAAYSIRNTTITAPFSGVVVAKHAQPGQYIGVGAAVVTLLDGEHLEIEAEVPTEIVVALTPGQIVSAMTGTGPAFDATIRAIVPQELATTRTRPVRLTADTAALKGALAVGQSVSVNIPVGAARRVLTVPKDALVQARGGWIVYAVEDGKATPLPVKIGASVGDRFEVIGGVEADIEVVVRGNERLRSGQAVQTMPAGGGEAPTAKGPRAGERG